MESNILETQFVTPEIASMLKEIGFSEGCITAFDTKGKLFPWFLDVDYENPYMINLKELRIIAAPLWTQVIDWFENKGIYIYWSLTGTMNWEWHIGPLYPDAEKYCEKHRVSFYEFQSPYLARESAIIEACWLMKKYYKNELQNNTR